MAVFPKIQSPCPYKNALSEIMEGDTCRMCKREVVDLNPMSDDERVAFLASCKSEVCVSYSFRPAIAAAIAGAALVTPLAAAAQELDVEDQLIIVGGITDPANVVLVSVDTDADVPELPILYDEAPATDEAADSGTRADVSQTVEHE